MKIEDEYTIPRRRMINRLREHYQIRDERVLSVMEEIPRHFFVPSALKSQAYADNALPISGNQTISQPYIVAKMTELLQLNPQSRVLEIGAGSGYQTIILSRLAKYIYSIERVSTLVEETRKKLEALKIQNVSLALGDGTLGWQDHAPFDAILAAAGSPHVPEPLLKQLKINGKLVLPVGDDRKSQRLIRITRTERGFESEDFGGCSFVPLIGEHGWN